MLLQNVIVCSCEHLFWNYQWSCYGYVWNSLCTMRLQHFTWTESHFKVSFLSQWFHFHILIITLSLPSTHCPKPWVQWKQWLLQILTECLVCYLLGHSAGKVDFIFSPACKQLMNLFHIRYLISNPSVMINTSSYLFSPSLLVILCFHGLEDFILAPSYISHLSFSYS